VLGQVKIDENITKMLSYNDKMIENINSKLENLSSSVKNQWSFNKMIKTQIAQIATSLPVSDSGKNLRQPETSLESVKMVSTRFNKPLCWESHNYFVDPPFVSKKGRSWPPNNHMLKRPTCLSQCLLRPWSKHQCYVQGNI
jgi:hypothetical protein